MGNAGNKSCLFDPASWVVRSILPYLKLQDILACSTTSLILRTNMVLRAGKLTGLVGHLNKDRRLYFVRRYRKRRRSNLGDAPMYSCDTNSMVVILNVREFVVFALGNPLDNEHSYNCEYPGCTYAADYTEDIVAHGKKNQLQHLLPGLCRHSSPAQLSHAYGQRSQGRVPWHDERRVEAHVLAITANTGYAVRANRAGYKDPPGGETLVWPETRPACSTPCEQVRAEQISARKIRAQIRSYKANPRHIL